MGEFERAAKAALFFPLAVLVLLAVFRHSGASSMTRNVGGILAAPFFLVALMPRLWLGAGATPAAYHLYYAMTAGGLVMLVFLFGRRDLE